MAICVLLISVVGATDYNESLQSGEETNTHSYEANNIYEDNEVQNTEGNNKYNGKKVDFSKKVVDNSKSSQNNKINVTLENFNQFFTTKDNIMTFTDEFLSDNANIEMDIQELPSNIDFFDINCNNAEYEDNNISITSSSNLSLNNFGLDIVGFNNVKIENIEFNYDTSYTDSYITLEESKLVVLNNVSINVDRNSTIDSRVIPLFINTQAIVENSTINARLMETMIDWDTGIKIPRQLGVLIYSPDVVFNNNTVNITVKGSLDPSMYSIYGVCSLRRNLTFMNNKLFVNDATGYAYGLVVRSGDSIISDNTILIRSVAYANGINIEGNNAKNNLVENNYINVTAGQRTAPWGNEAVAYGALILDYSYTGGTVNASVLQINNNTYNNNTIRGSARQIYGIEVFGGKNTVISNNNINITGYYAMDIGIAGAYTNITNNNISATGKTNKSGSSVDYLKPVTSGVYVFMSIDGINITNNSMEIYKGSGVLLDESDNLNVENNIILVEEHDNTIELGGRNHTVTSNILYSRKGMAEDTIAGKSNNIVYNNGPTGTNLSIELPEKLFVNEENPIIITLTNTAGNKLNNQIVNISTDNQNDSLTTDENGTVVFNYKTAQVGNTYITAIYNGSNIFNASNITVPISTQKHDIKIMLTGNNQTIKVNLTNEYDKPVSNAEIILTLPDETNISIITDTNGISQTQLNLEPGTYNITATYSGNESNNRANSTIEIYVKESTRLKLNSSVETLELGETTNMTAVFITDDDEKILEGIVIFKINGKTLRDEYGKVIYVEIIDGKATFEDVNITQEWTKADTTIQAVFTGDDEHDPIFTPKMTINLAKPEARVTLEAPVRASPGEKITLKATVTDKNKLVNGGRVTFKLNGKTLKDSDGKTLYAIVTEGVATADYTIPAKTKAKTYNLTAVFTDTVYERSENHMLFEVAKE